LTCPAWVNHSHLSTSIFCFVGRALNQLIPSCVRNTFSQTVIPDHAFDVQRFKGDESKHRNERMAQLMSKVAATVGDPFVNTPRRFALLASLRFRQCLFVRAKETWIRNLLAIGERTEMRQPNINTDASIICGKGLRFNFNRKARIPFTRRRARDRKSLNLAFNRAMQFNLYVSDFREAQLIIFESETGLCVGERIVSEAGTEAREARFAVTLFHATKEVLKGFIKSAKNILQYLTVNFFEFRSCLFDFRQLICLLKVADRLPFKAVSVSALLQSGVIKFAQQSKRLIHAHGLSARRKQPVLEGYSLCYIFVSHVCHISIVSGTGESRNAVRRSVSARLHCNRR